MKKFNCRKINIRIATGILAGVVTGMTGVLPVCAHGDDPAESSTDASTAEISISELPDVPGNDTGDSTEGTSAEPPLTPDGNMSLVDDIGSTDGSGKQFITCVTKNGNYFYLIIDRDDNGTENVHFLNMVDESDLLSLMDKDEVKKYEQEQNTSSAEMSDVSGTESSAAEQADTEPEKTSKKKADTRPAILTLLLFAGVAGIFGYKKLKGTRKAKAEKPDPDLDYTDDDYEYPEDEESEDATELEDNKPETEAGDPAETGKDETE